jgi:hypothetical protein
MQLQILHILKPDGTPTFSDLRMSDDKHTPPTPLMPPEQVHVVGNVTLRQDFDLSVFFSRCMSSSLPSIIIAFALFFSQFPYIFRTIRHFFMFLI